MKKIIFILIPLLFLVTGCWDYKELNDMATVVGAALDYEDEKFIVTYEILNDQEDAKSKSYLIRGEGKTYLDSILDASRKSTKTLDFMHLKGMILGEDIAEEALDQTVDFELRNPKLSSIFNTVIAKDKKAYEIFEAKEDDSVIADLIATSLKNDINNGNIAVNYTFDELLDFALSYGSEMVISSVTESEGRLDLQGIGVFNKFKLKGYLNLDESLTYNLLQSKTSNDTYKVYCTDEKMISMAIYSSKADISADKNKLAIDLKSSGTITNNNCDYDLMDESIYNNLEKDFEKVIKKNIMNLVNTTRDLDSDILGFTKSYYFNTRVKDEKIWKKLDLDVKVDVSINRKGLIYEVLEDDN